VGGVLAEEEAVMNVRIALLFNGILIAASTGAAQAALQPQDPDQAPIASVDRFSDNAATFLVRSADNHLPGPNEPIDRPAVTQGVWFWGNTDDVLFRLVTLGSVDLEKEGYTRLTYGTVHAPMPPMGAAIKTSDQLWKIIAFIRSINPPGSNPPDKVLPKE
jgi:hypothetical protein